jgi:hypothetical protein
MTVAGSIHQLIYISAAKAEFSEAALTRLLLRARENNRKLGVSGLLIHHSGSFFQVLEGSEVIVEALFDRIGRDPRHHRVAVLKRSSVPSAVFGEWSMGFVGGGQPAFDRIPGYNDFFRRGLANTNLVESGAQAAALALAFREGRFRQLVTGH